MKNPKKSLSEEDVKHIAKLANLPLTEKEIKALENKLETSFEYINKIQSLDTSNVTETSQVTGLENIFREDIVDKNRMLSQKEALYNAPNTHNGYFKVKALFEPE